MWSQSCAGMKWKVLVLFGAFLAYYGPHICRIITALGFHKTIYNQSPGKCHALSEIARGSEDIQTLPSGLAFISSGLRFVDAIGNPAYEGVEGKLFLFDFNRPHEKAVELAINVDLDDFNPHGLSVIQIKGRTLLYVVNHLANLTTAIEKFDFDVRSRSLTHIKTFLHQHIRYVNDVVAVNEDEFYFTNCLYYPSSLEMFLGLKWHSIGFCSLDNCRLVVEKSHFNNGINLSKDKRYIYSSDESRSVKVYSRQSDNGLDLVQEFTVDVSVDNIDVDRDSGDLWVTTAPVRYTAVAMFYNPLGGGTSPSLVLKLSVRDGLITGASQVYASDGEEISMASVAVRHKDAMLVGSVFLRPIYCTLEYVTP